MEAHCPGRARVFPISEVTDGNIKSFERVARKYGVDFALKRTATSQPPRYLVVSSPKDADAPDCCPLRNTRLGSASIRPRPNPSIRRQLGSFGKSLKRWRNPRPGIQQEVADEKTPQNQYGQGCKNQFALLPKSKAGSGVRGAALCIYFTLDPVSRLLLIHPGMEASKRTRKPLRVVFSPATFYVGPGG